MKTTAAALTFAALTGIAGAVTTMTTGVTSPSPRIVMAEPSAPLCPEMLARCAPIPPAPMTRLDVSVPEGEAKTEAAAEYSAAWAEVVR